MAPRSLRRTNPPTFPARQRPLTGMLSGESYRLGPEVGSGGEGVVHAIVQRPELLAKLYRCAPTQVTVEKLRALARAGTPGLLAVAALPTECLKSPSGATVGFVMPRIADARGIHELYSPRARVRHFPSADFRFLIHAAANIARLVAAIHGTGFIIGDVNHGNILVRNDGTVAAIDCDSFQIGDGSRFPCGVGVELFTAPELLGQPFGSVRRTPNHDAFGLAVLIFHLLFMGRHPFAGRYLCKGEMPIEKAIAESRFAYSGDTRRTRMAPPPLTLPLAGTGPATAELFERAFHPNSRTGGRPTPDDWLRVLDALKNSLSVCSSVPWHQYSSNLTVCPWCAVEHASGAKLFGGLVRPDSAAIADLRTLWRRYLGVADPGPPQLVPCEEDWVPPPGSSVGKSRLYRRYVGFAAGTACMALAPFTATVNPIAASVPVIAGAVLIAILCRPRHVSEEALAATHDVFVRAEETWQALVRDWQAQPAAPDFSDKRQAIEGLKARLDALIPERKARIKALAKTITQAEQRARYLEQFRIEDAGLYNMGPARRAVLRSWGIETAAEIDEAKLADVPGFGRNLTDRLVNWRDGLERRFRFDPIAAADPLEVRKVDREIAVKRMELMRDLRIRIVGLENQARRILDDRATLWKRLETAFNTYMLARPT